MSLTSDISSLPYESCRVVVSDGLKELEEKSGIAFDVLDKVYHSSTRYEMEVNADLMSVDLCNPYVLFFLAKQTAYHHAFWPHTAKRFTAFKNILRHNKIVRMSLVDCVFFVLAIKARDDISHNINANPLWKIPGKKQELANWKQIVEIVEKAIKDQSHEA